MRCSSERRRGSGGRDWSAAVTLPIFFLRVQQARPSGCGFSLSRPREGRLLPSERTANGGNLKVKFYFGEGAIICNFTVL